MEKEEKRVHQKLSADDLYFQLKEKDEKERTNQIKPSEYACDCQGKYCDGFPVAINPVLIEKIEALRSCIDHPVRVISGVRCEKQNKAMDGSDLSFHKLGRAADLQCEYQSVDELADRAESVGLLVIRDYREGIIHCQWND